MTILSRIAGASVVALAAWTAADVAAAGEKGRKPDRSASAVIPADRVMAWQPGVPGGIPQYPVFASVKDAPYLAKGDGQADDTAAIQQALDACPPGKAVRLPAGTYRLTGELRLTKAIAIRGDGPDKTRLINEATTKHIISVINWDQEPVVAKITQGCTKGSASVAVNDAAKYQPGDLLLADQLNDPELVDNKGCGGVCGWASREKGTRAMGQLVQLAAKNGNALTLRRPLSFTFKEALAPEVVRTVKSPIAGAGVEDLCLEMASRHTDNSSSIKIMNGLYCWVKNVESFKTWYGGHVTLQSCLGCEVRDSYFHHTHAFGGGYGYGIFVFHHTTDTLVENNLFYYLNAPMLCECSGPGNVFGYNFSSRTFGRDYPDTDWAHNDMAMHGAHCYMNLFEGNFGSTTGFDFYWGSASHTTLLRNYLDMDCRTVAGRPMMAVIGVRIDAKNYFMNVVGNVLGAPGTQGIVETPTIAGFNQKLVWRLGYSTPSGTGPPNDPKTADTALRHGNFNSISQQVQWDPKIPGRQLPKSLYLTAKPAFFGKLPWPAVGPDIKPLVGTIPARERFLKTPAKERAAQDQLFLGEFLLAAGKKDKALLALQEVVGKYADTPLAVRAKKRIAEMK